MRSNIQSDGRELAYVLLKHSDWLRLRLMDQSQEILLGHAVFASSEYGMTQLPSYCTFD